MTRQRTRAAAERGYSLIEILIAIGILGTVMMGILTLFVLSQRNVYSGKLMTTGVAVATRVVEDLNTLSKTSMLTAFGLETATTGTAQTAGGQTFGNSFKRTTATISSTTDPKGFLQRWKDEIVNNNKFKDGEVTLIFTPVKDSVLANNPSSCSMTTSTIVRVRVLVTWREAARSRQVVLDTVKVERQ